MLGSPHVFALLAALALQWTAARGDDQRPLPTDANVVNVRDHGAKGDGVTDDTEAIRAAIRAGIERGRYATPGMVYFPDGTYLVTGPLESRVEPHGWSGGWRAGMILRGQSRTGTVIKLQDRHPDYADPANPRYVIATGSESDKRTSESDKPLDGGGNRAFRHGVYHLTVDVGRGNPGATAIDFIVSNRGSVEHVTITTSDPDRAGFCGLRMDRHWPGPGLIRHVAVHGFDHAIRMDSHYQYSMTFEHIAIKGQRQAGILTKNNVLSIRGLDSANTVPAVRVTGDHGFVTLLDAKLHGGGGDPPAIISQGHLMLRNVEVAGYAAAIKHTRKGRDDVPVTGSSHTFDQYATNRHTLANLPHEMAPLPVVESPEFWTRDVDQWANVVSFGATPNQNDDDDTAAIQAAIDSGKPVVYLPNGSYRTRGTVIVRGEVGLILGMQSSFGPEKDSPVDPAVRFETTTHPVTLEHLWINGAVEHASKQAVALRHSDMKDGYRNTPEGTGDMFFDDTIGKPIRILHPQRVFGRQVNCEFGDDPLIENHGGDLWILGYKTEGEMTCIATYGGRTELLGALLYPLRLVRPESPAFINDAGQVRLTYRLNGPDYPVHVKQRAGEDAAWQQLYQKAAGRGAALFTAAP